MDISLSIQYDFWCHTTTIIDLHASITNYTRTNSMKGNGHTGCNTFNKIQSAS